MYDKQLCECDGYYWEVVKTGKSESRESEERELVWILIINNKLHKLLNS